MRYTTSDNEQTVLKLLVAQLQSQNADNPQDGVQVEQTIQSRQDLDSIKTTLKAAQAAASAEQDSPSEQ